MLAHELATAEGRTDLISIPDVYDCLPDRAHKSHGRFHYHPSWSPTYLAEPAIVTTHACWDQPNVHSIIPRFQVTFHRKQSTFSFLSRKTGYTQTGESPGEFMRAQDLEVDPTIVDYQLGGLRMNWITPDGPRRFTLDNVAVNYEGLIIAEEIKASGSYFAECDYAQLMARADQGLSSVGIKFNKVTADQLEARRRRRYNVGRAFDDRFARFDARHLEIVQNAFDRDKSGLSLAELAESLKQPDSIALQIVNAMMTKRHVAYDLDAPVDRETRITAAPKASSSIADIRAITR